MDRQTGKPPLPFVLAGLILILAMSACGESASPTPEPTDTPAPTSTPQPTNTPKPTTTPASTDTPEPTNTPRPTETPAPEPTPTPERTEARVVAVVDGDTINVDIEGVVYALRYIGVDCPEPGEWGGAAATEANSQLVENKAVYLEKDTSETDRYDRLLRYVYLEDGTLSARTPLCLGRPPARAVAWRRLATARAHA
jgi:endonuclease YncB( thermonuclease family)